MIFISVDVKINFKKVEKISKKVLTSSKNCGIMPK